MPQHLPPSQSGTAIRKPVVGSDLLVGRRMRTASLAFTNERLIAPAMQERTAHGVLASVEVTGFANRLEPALALVGDSCIGLGALAESSLVATGFFSRQRRF